MKIQTKPQNIGTFAGGNAAWDDYKFQNEMLRKYEEKLEKSKTNSWMDVENITKRIEQYKSQVQLSESCLVEFCQKHNITI